jgi:hypothetical protein
MLNRLALARLVWRPALLGWVFLLAFSMLLPGLVPGNPFENGFFPMSDANLKAFLWIESVVLMGTLGAILGIATQSARQSLFSYTVPSIGGALVGQKMLIALVMAVALGLGLGLAGDHRGVPAIFGSALFFFVAGSAVTDTSIGRGGRGVIIAVTTILVFEAMKVGPVVERAPLSFAAAFIMLAAFLAAREASASSARSIALFEPPVAGYPLAWWSDQGGSIGRDRESQVASAGFLKDVRTWIKAADFETFGAQRYGWVKWLVSMVLWNCGFGYFLLGNPDFSAILGTFQVSAQGHKVPGRWAAPISRKRRADIQFLVSLFDNISYFSLAVLVSAVLFRSGLPRIRLFATASASHSVFALYPLASIWAPLGQWVRATSVGTPKQLAKSAAWSLQLTFHTAGSIVLSILTFFAMRRVAHASSAGAVVVLTISLAVVVQALYWLALRRHFSRKDLV